MFKIPDQKEEILRQMKSMEEVAKKMDEFHKAKDKKETKRFNLNLWLPILVMAFFSTLATLQQCSNRNTQKIQEQQLQQLQQISSKSDSVYKLLYQMQSQKDTINKK